MEALKQLEDLVFAKITVIKTMLTVIGLEARLAGLSVFPLLLTVCFLFIVLMTFWLSTTLLIGYGILFASNNFLLTLVLVFLMNLVVLIGLGKYLAFTIKNMSFEKTRSYFLQNKDIENDHEKRINRKNNDAG